MKPVKFEGANLILTESEHYQTIPVKEERGTIKEVVTCWEFTDEQIEHLKETKKLFITQLLGLQTFNPMLLGLEEPI